MKLMISSALAAATLFSIFASPETSAFTDAKMWNGSDCKAFGATASTDLAFSGFGVKNLASSARNIICPVTKDSDFVWDGDASSPVNNAQFAVNVETGAIAASFSCTLQVTDQGSSTLVRSYSMPSGGVIPANTISSRSVSNLNSVAIKGITDKVSLVCTLGPSVRLLGYSLAENSTDIP